MDIEDIHKNSKILIEGVPYNVVEAEFVKPGKGRAIYRLRLKNLMDGSSIDRTYHSSEKVDTADVTVEEKQFLYQEADHYVFMNTDNFEQSFISADQIGDKKYFLKEGELVNVMVLDDRPIDVTPPTFVELKVTKTQPSSRADTVTAQNKEAVLETGFTIGVPTFVKEGDVIKVDTRTGTYVERVTGKK
ncbi:MAG: elongation factor P [Chloroflexi bacterium]|nr:elongation factor P [Chloroflexota bacterium]